MNYEKIMSKKEALEWLDRHQRAIAWQDWDNPNDKDQAKDYAAICIAMEALDKQISKRVDGGKFTGQCVCGKFVFSDMKFCPNCGQRLDWSD